MNGAQWFVRTLKDRGVKQVFALCGNGLNPFLDACLDYKVKIIGVRNEQAATYMADLWGGFTGQMGVVAVSSGPGHTNTLTGVANAWWDGRPLMMVSGMSDLRTRGRGHFQELDQVEMVAPVCKYANLVKNIETLPSDTHAAINAAVTPRPGPVHLTIPNNVFNAEVRTTRDRTPAQVAPQGTGDADLVKDAAKMLSKAKRPIMVVGSGAFYARSWPAVQKFAKLTGIPIYTLLWDRGCIEQRIPEYVGIVSPEVNAGAELISKADVILTLGGRVDDRLGYGGPPMVAKNVKFIRIDADPEEVNRFVPADIGIAGSPSTVLGQIAAEGKKMKWNNAAWLEKIRKRRREMLDYWMAQPVGDAAPMASLRLCQEIMPFLTGDTTFLLDGGNIGRWAHMLFFFDRHPSHYFTCGISGVIGWGIPGGLAAKLARPNKPVILLSGDGSAGFTLGDIQTAVRFGTPFVALIAHDSAWGIVADGLAEDRQAGSGLGEIRYDRVAEALGAKGVYIDNAKQIAPAIRKGLKARVPTFIHVPTTIYGIRSYRKQFGTAPAKRRK
ncbi:MAG: thiamine pyrophosphate-binding protein [Planctomycetes bacterium]|nr:thiamine pyrophosphate-binding protein [Planctomycetota bacterium]